MARSLRRPETNRRGVGGAAWLARRGWTHGRHSLSYLLGGVRAADVASVVEGLARASPIARGGEPLRRAIESHAKRGSADSRHVLVLLLEAAHRLGLSPRGVSQLPAVSTPVFPRHVVPPLLQPSYRRRDGTLVGPEMSQKIHRLKMKRLEPIFVRHVAHLARLVRARGNLRQLSVQRPQSAASAGVGAIAAAVRRRRR
jgi:hypothetical protein